MDSLIQAQCRVGKYSGHVLVARGSEILLDTHCDAPGIQPERGDVYMIGSNTKQFTGALILKLQEEGKLKINDPVGKFIPRFSHPELTLRQLLNHTSGLGDYATHSYDIGKFSVDDLVDMVSEETLKFKPGDHFDYSNSGYALLTKVIEVASGQSYETYLKRTILTPLGMTHTGLLAQGKEIPGLKTAYAPKDMAPGGKPEVFPAGNLSLPVGAGAMYSTTHDMLIWNLAFFGGKVLKPESLVLIRSSNVNVNEQAKYGFGWVFGKTSSGEEIFQHTGGIGGFSTMNNYLPNSKLSVILLSNWMDADFSITRELNKIITGK